MQAVRDDDGLAKSSRNGYLTAAEREIAPLLHQVLQETARRILAMGAVGSVAYSALQDTMMARLDDGGFRAEYLEVRRNTDLQLPEVGDENLVILVSAWLGKARLIDNVQVLMGEQTVI